MINYAGAGGIEKYTETLIKAMRDKECECLLVYGEKGKLVEKIEKAGVKVFKLQSKGPLDVDAARKLKKLCDSESVDVIHAQGGRENCLSVISKIMGANVRVVFTWHFTDLQPLRWRVMNRISSIFNDAVIAVCKESKKTLIKNGFIKNKIKTVLNGVESDNEQKLTIGSKEIVFVTVSRFSQEKGLMFLVEALEYFKKICSIPFLAYIAGDGELYYAVKEEVRQRGLDGCVFCIGYCANVQKLLRSADIYLLPSQKEALSIAALEAIACGLPMIATDVGGNREIVTEDGECGLISDYGDIVTYAENIKKLAENEELRKILGAVARRKAETKFSIEKQILSVYDIYCGG